LIYEQSARALKLFVLKVDIKSVLERGFVKVRDDKRGLVFNVLVNREHYEVGNFSRLEASSNNS
jgi:hypothetical protein